MFETSKQEKLAAQRRRELQTIHTSTLSEIHLLRTLMFLGPAGHVQLLGSFQTVNQEEPFVRHWIADATTCDYVSDGSTIDKVECCSGFVMSHREQYHINSVWVGDTLKHLREVKATLGIAVADTALRSLVKNGEPVYFVRPDYPEHCPVYRLDTRHAQEACEAGYSTELKTPFVNKKLRGRPVQAGDQLVLLPPDGDWVKSMRFFPADWLPADQYRRV